MLKLGSQQWYNYKPCYESNLILLLIVDGVVLGIE